MIKCDWIQMWLNDKYDKISKGNLPEPYVNTEWNCI